MGAEVSDLNWFDIAVISVVTLSTLFAFFRGVIKAVFSLITWLGASLGAAIYYPQSVEFFSEYVDNERAVIVLGSVGVFLVLFIILAIITSVIVNLLSSLRGGAMDRTLGFAFGLLRGVIIVCLSFFSINITSTMLQYGDELRPGPDWFVAAETYDTLGMLTDALLTYIPEEIPERLIATIEEFKDKSMAVIGGAVMEDGVDSALPSMISDADKKIMTKVISSLPEEDLNKLYSKYEGNTSELSDLERMAIFRDMLAAYNELKKTGKIVADAASDLELKTLDKALNGVKNDNPFKDNGVGYDKKNLKQMDRLINNL